MAAAWAADSENNQYVVTGARSAKSARGVAKMAQNNEAGNINLCEKCNACFLSVNVM